MFLIEEKIQSERGLSAGECDEVSFVISSPAVVEREAVSILWTGEFLPESSPGSTLREKTV